MKASLLQPARSSIWRIIKYNIITIAVLGSKTKTWVESFVTSKNTLFLSDYTFMVRVLYVFNPSNLFIPNPGISSRKGA